MATIKSFTSLEQSRKLAEILPLESADMVYYKYANRPHKNDLDSPTVFKNNNEWYWIDIYDKTPCGKDDIMAWSLAALLGVLPEIDDTSLILEKVKAEDGYDGYYYHIEYKDKILIPYSKNPVDACVAMIEKLHELNLL